MKIFVLDNYDSFTYNLVQYLEEMGAEVTVVRNDRTTPQAIAQGRYDRIVISPGPGRPERAGITLDLIGGNAADAPLLGVCLGHQAIAQKFGGRVVAAPTLMHGKTSPVEHDGRGIFRGVSSPFDAARYHSLCVDPSSVPDCLEISARTPDGVIMGLRHRSLPIEGVQFHPESILTPVGKKLLANFLKEGPC